MLEVLRIMADGMNRRDFQRIVTAGVLGGTLYSRGAQASEKTPETPQDPAKPAAPQAKLGTVTVPAREVPVTEDCDVVVCGAGPAGFAAAMASARSGAKTRLIETHGCLGGVWTAGLLSWIIDARNKPGIMAELLKRLDERGGQRQYGGSYAYDPEIMKWTLEEMCQDAGVEVRMLTQVSGAVVDDQKRLTHVLTDSKSGREAWKAKAFVDCTGDGDLAALAGCRYDVGMEGTGRTQPLSLLCLVTGIDIGQVSPYVCGINPHLSAKTALFEIMEKGGVTPSYHHPTLFHLHDDLFCLMSNHEYGVSAVDAQGLTDATMRARAELHRQMKALRKYGQGWENVQMVATAEQIGVREGRRIRGLYEVSESDLEKGSKFEDGVCTVTFGIDVHSTDPTKTKAIEKARFKSRPYQIPLRALIAADVNNLMMAGRCISGDFIAHSSYRVTGNSVALGEAAGATAAVAALTNVAPKDVPWPEAEKAITKQRFNPVA